MTLRSALNVSAPPPLMPKSAAFKFYHVAFRLVPQFVDIFVPFANAD